MFALTVPPPKPKPETIPGYVVQVRYGSELERLVPFDPDDADYDLRFRGWTPNGFATHGVGADQLHAAHAEIGWQSRILPGVAEKQPNGDFEFFTVH